MQRRLNTIQTFSGYHFTFFVYFKLSQSMHELKMIKVFGKFTDKEQTTDSAKSCQSVHLQFYTV